jgi:cardiolipin synthase
MNAAALRSLPNVISLSRLFLAAAFVIVRDTPARVALVIVASITDYLDGWVARRSGSASKWGALIDPITDRVFALAAVATLLFEGTLTTGQYFVLISRDLATAVGFLVARVVPWLRPVQFQARWLGKVVTAGQLLTLAAALLRADLIPPLVILVGVTSAASIGDYTLALWRGRVRS